MLPFPNHTEPLTTTYANSAYSNELPLHSRIATSALGQVFFFKAEQILKIKTNQSAAQKTPQQQQNQLNKTTSVSGTEIGQADFFPSSQFQNTIVLTLRPMYVPQCAMLTAKLQYACILAFSASTGDTMEQQLTYSSTNKQMHLNLFGLPQTLG